MQDLKVGIGIQGGESTIAYMNRIKQTADEYYDNMIKKSRAYTTSGKEALADIEAQIKALERKKNLEIQEMRVKAGGKETSEIKGEKEGSKILNSLLRELIETTKDTAKNAIREDRKGVEEQINQSKTVNQLKPKGESKAILEESLKNMFLQENKISESREKVSVGDKIQRTANVGMSLATSQNEYMMLAGATGAIIPRFGNAIGQGLSRVFAAAGNYQQAYTGAYAQTGRMREKFGYGLDSYGIDMPMAYREMQSLASARGGAYGEREAIKTAKYERALGLQSGDIQGLEKTLRGSKSTGTGVIESLGGRMIAGGGMAKGDMSLLPEYLRTLVSLNQEQLNTMGEVDTGINEKMMLGITNLDKSFKNPEVLQNVLGKINQGLKTAATPQAEALQYSVLGGMASNQGKSFFDIQMEREKGGVDYFEGVMNQLKNISGGGGDMFYQNIMEMFGTSATQAKKIGVGFESGDLRKSFEASQNKGLGVDIEDRASTATGEILKSSINFQNTFSTVGVDLVKIINELIQKIQDWIDNNTETEEDRKKREAEAKRLMGTVYAKTPSSESVVSTLSFTANLMK